MPDFTAARARRDDDDVRMACAQGFSIWALTVL